MRKKLASEKNSLEQLLLRVQEWLTRNKTKAYQFILVFALVLVVILLARTGFFGGSSKLNGVDAAYYAASQSFMTPQPSVFSEAAALYSKGDVGAELQAELGESYLKVGANEVARKGANLAAVETEGGENADAAALDPGATFKSAVEAFDAAVALGSDELKARAFYGAGAAQESLASIAADDAQVVAALDEAKANYQKVAETCADSPYCELASQRLASLNRALTVDYYKIIAAKFNNPETPVEPGSILSGQTGLEPGSVEVSGFDLGEDASEETEPALEVPAEATPAAEPASEVPAEATPAVEPALEVPAEATPAVEPASEVPAEATPAAESASEVPAEATPVVEPAPEVPAEATPAAESASEVPAEAPAQAE